MGLGPIGGPRVAVSSDAQTKPAESEEQASSGALRAGPGSAFFHDEPGAGTKLERLRDAIADSTFTPVAASKIPVPDDVMKTLLAAKNVLVIGHTATDGDAVGSVLGLTRALQLNGVTATGVIDDELPGQLRSIPGSNEVHRFDAERAAGKYDLVVMVDVAQAARIGGAAAAVAAAPNVLVVDHHETEPTRKSLGMGDSAKLTTWIESSADAASLLVAGITDRLLAGKEVSAADRTRVAGPELAGMYTDSGAFNYPGVDKVSEEVFKSELQLHFGGQLDALQATIHYDLPKPAQALLQSPPDLSALSAGDDKAKAIAAKAQAAIDAGTVPHVEQLTGGGRALVVPEAFYNLAYEAAKLSDPAVVHADILGQLKLNLGKLLDDSHRLGVMMFESNGNTYVSTRSLDAGPAVQLAESLGGGGHDRASGAKVAAPLSEVVAKVHAWADAQSVPKSG
jgi:nanoRNase/pAp phosphatase (c-di-AMP/oligoRNAs hydrolase)